MATAQNVVDVEGGPPDKCVDWRKRYCVRPLARSRAVPRCVPSPILDRCWSSLQDSGAAVAPLTDGDVSLQGGSSASLASEDGASSSGGDGLPTQSSIWVVPLRYGHAAAAAVLLLLLGILQWPT